MIRAQMTVFLGVLENNKREENMKKESTHAPCRAALYKKKSIPAMRLSTLRPSPRRTSTIKPPTTFAKRTSTKGSGSRMQKFSTELSI